MKWFISIIISCNLLVASENRRLGQFDEYCQGTCVERLVDYHLEHHENNFGNMVDILKLRKISKNFNDYVCNGNHQNIFSYLMSACTEWNSKLLHFVGNQLGEKYFFSTVFEKLNGYMHFMKDEQGFVQKSPFLLEIGKRILEKNGGKNGYAPWFDWAQEGLNSRETMFGTVLYSCIGQSDVFMNISTEITWKLFYFESSACFVIFLRLPDDVVKDDLISYRDQYIVPWKIEIQTIVNKIKERSADKRQGIVIHIHDFYDNGKESCGTNSLLFFILCSLWRQLLKRGEEKMIEVFHDMSSININRFVTFAFSAFTCKKQQAKIEFFQIIKTVLSFFARCGGYLEAKEKLCF